HKTDRSPVAFIREDIILHPLRYPAVSIHKRQNKNWNNEERQCLDEKESNCLFSNIRIWLFDKSLSAKDADRCCVEQAIPETRRLAKKILVVVVFAKIDEREDAHSESEHCSSRYRPGVLYSKPDTFEKVIRQISTY